MKAVRDEAETIREEAVDKFDDTKQLKRQECACELQLTKNRHTKLAHRNHKIRLESEFAIISLSVFLKKTIKDL